MRCRLVFLCLFLGLAVAASAQNVRITWVGQACFIVQAEGGPTVVADPPAPAIAALPEVTADAVTVSHNHPDHNNTQGVRGNFALVDGRPVTARTQMTAGGMPFVLIPGFHDAQSGAASGPNTMIQWTQGGLRFAHLGDFGQEQLTDAQLADLQNLDVLIIPAGGFFTIETDEAAAIAAQLRARVTILAHYRTPVSATGLATLGALPAAAAPFGAVVYKPSTVVLSRDRLPSSPEIWVMEPSAAALVVNSGGFAAGVPVAPASLASIFGAFTGSDTVSASELPLPRRLGQTEVFIQNNAAPLLYVSPGQVNVQIPSGLGPGQYLVEVKVGGQTVARAPVTVVSKAPGLFAATNADGRLNSPANPARRGDTVQIYGTGQGLSAAVAAVTDGAAAPATPALTRFVPQVTVGGRRAVVKVSALAPGAVGVWQIQATIPADAATGSAVPVTARLGSISATISMAIQ